MLTRGITSIGQAVTALARRSIIVTKESAFPNFVRNMSALPKCPLTVDNKFRQEYVKVAVLGADSPTGEATAFLLKQNPVVSQIYLYGEIDVVGITADLKHLDTRSEVKGYHGHDGINKAVRRADIVLIIGHDKWPLDADAECKLMSESKQTVELAEACCRYAPKAIIVVCVNPVSMTLPLVAAVFRRTHWYHPGRIIGSVALAQIRANSLLARYQDLDPASVHVPLVGGPDMDSVVPLFSRATPVSVSPIDIEILQEKMNKVEEVSPIESSPPCKLVTSHLSEAYGINQLVTTIGIGLCGDSNAVCTAYVRQNILSTCRHLVTTVRFGPGGVVHNFGVPKLTRMELKLLEKSALLLDKREQMALNLLSEMEKRGPPAVSKIQISPYCGPKCPTTRD